MSAILLALAGAGRAVAADWATGFESRVGANAVTNATAVDAAGNVYVAGYFVAESMTLGAVTLTRIAIDSGNSSANDPRRGVTTGEA